MQCIKCRAELPNGAVYCPACGKKQAPQQRKRLKRANGTGTVYKLSGRRTRPWVAQKQRVTIGYYETRTEALTALERLSGKDLTERYNMTFEDVYNEWKKEHYRDVGPSAQVSYDHAYKIFSELKDRKFRSLRTADYQAIIDNHANKKNSTVSKYKQLITQMSTWAIREDIITTNYASYVKIPELKKVEKSIFTDEDIEKLRKDNSEAAMIVLMLIYTGMRISELFELPIAACYDKHVIGGEKTEAGRNRVIPIRPEGRKYFEYFKAKASGELLLSGYDGDKIASNFRKRQYYPLLERLGIEKKNPHCTRHTFTTWAVNNGVKPETLQKILGHTKYETTMGYFHADIDELVSAVELPVTNTLLTKKN